MKSENKKFELTDRELERVNGGNSSGQSGTFEGYCKWCKQYVNLLDRNQSCPNCHVPGPIF